MVAPGGDWGCLVRLVCWVYSVRLLVHGVHKGAGGDNASGNADLPCAAVYTGTHQ